MPRRKQDDEDDDRPPRKKRRRDEEDEESDAEPTAWERYRKSPARFALLGALVVAMLVLGYLLVQKLQREGG